MQEFTEKTYSDLCSYATAYPNEECCAFVLKDLTIVELDNIAENKEQTFTIKGEEYLKYKKDILCIFHSHPHDCGPSPEDYLVGKRICLPMLIYSIPESRFYYVPKGTEECLQYDYTAT